jgi:hypothetical protein
MTDLDLSRVIDDIEEKAIEAVYLIKDVRYWRKKRSRDEDLRECVVDALKKLFELRDVTREAARDLGAMLAKAREENGDGKTQPGGHSGEAILPDDGETLPREP